MREVPIWNESMSGTCWGGLAPLRSAGPPQGRMRRSSSLSHVKFMLSAATECVHEVRDTSVIRMRL